MKTSDAVHSLKQNFKDAKIVESEFMGQIAIEVQKEDLKEILSFLKRVPEPGYEVLMDLTGVDYVRPTKYTQVIYFLNNPTNYERVRVTVNAGRNDTLPSVVDIWEGANWYERELFDLFGVHFAGHPDLKRILMPDDWVGHPLLKDYALTEESVEFKHGVKPKVPSQIIPYVGRSKKH